MKTYNTNFTTAEQCFITEIIYDILRGYEDRFGSPIVSLTASIANNALTEADVDNLRYLLEQRRERGFDDRRALEECLWKLDLKIRQGRSNRS